LISVARPSLRATLEARGGVGWVTARAMVLVLCIGDMHVPHRATDLPPKFKKLLVPGKIQHVLCTGDLCVKEAYDYLRGLCPNPGNVHVVQGQYDEMGGGVGGDVFPETKTVRVGAFTIGLIHGHQVVPWGDVDALAAVQRKMNADVLVVGHRGAFASHAVEDRLILFPGSATGVASFRETDTSEKDPNPSFVLMDVAGDALVAYVYELEDGEVKVDKIEHSKKPTRSVVAG
jgi:vacuolar protein sorting-associated protein 29